MKTLIIRTDRLGDFYQTIPYINCLTRIYGKTNVDIVVKKNIYSHIKKKKYLYNSLYSFEKNGIFSKVFLILKLRKNNYKQIIIFDGKDRSIILSKFLIEDLKIANSNIVANRHIKAIFYSKSNDVVKTIAFNSIGTVFESYLVKNNKSSMNIAGTLISNNWNGQSNIEFIINDISVNNV